MKNKITHKYSFILLFFFILIVFVINLSFGSVNIPFKDIVNSILNQEATKESWNYIILNYRLPKAITAVLVGSGLAISGLLMQTLFRNPLAGPYVLGVSSGASLGVAVLILGSSVIGGGFLAMSQNNFLLSIAASAGSFLVLFAVIIVARKVKNTMTILIIGLMFSSLTAAVISILAYFSSAENLQQYLFWSFGSLGNLTWNEILIFSILIVISLVIILPTIKPLNSLLLGENYAKSLGINFNRTRNLILISTSIFTGVITAFSGPIAFVGLATPHITKLLFDTSNHKILIPAVAVLGAIIMLISDTISQLPNSEFTLPINAITSLFGAPVVIWLLVRKKKISL